MKTSITQDSNGYVTISYDDAISGARITTTYFAPRSSSGKAGYVKIADGRNYPQVCEGLASTGNTLTATPETLLSVIRREYRKMRASEKSNAYAY